jgi:hypothetical protein
MTYVPVLADLDIDDPTDLVDLELAQVSLLRTAERGQRAAVHGWGCPPLVIHVGVGVAGSTSTLHLVLPVPPSTGRLEVQITGAGGGQVTIATPYGSLVGFLSETQATLTLGLLPVETRVGVLAANGPRREWRYVPATVEVVPPPPKGGAGPTSATLDAITLIPVIDADATWGTTWHASFAGATRSVTVPTGADRLTAVGPQRVYDYNNGFSAACWIRVGEDPSGVIWMLGEVANARGISLSLTTTGLRLRITDSAGVDRIVRDYAQAWGTSLVWRHVIVWVDPTSAAFCFVKVDNVFLIDTAVTSSPADVGDTMEVLSVGAATTGGSPHGLALHSLAFFRGPMLSTGELAELYADGVGFDPRATSAGGRVTDAWCADLGLGGTTSTVVLPSMGLQPTCAQLEGSTGTVLATSAP